MGGTWLRLSPEWDENSDLFNRLLFFSALGTRWDTLLPLQSFSLRETH